MDEHPYELTLIHHVCMIILFAFSFNLGLISKFNP
jgi:hypothetical protein